MEYMVFEDSIGIAIFCALVGIGVTLAVGVIFMYIAILSFMEDNYE